MLEPLLFGGVDDPRSLGNLVLAYLVLLMLYDLECMSKRNMYMKEMMDYNI